MAEKIHCDICDTVLVQERFEYGFRHESWEITEVSYLFDIRLPPMFNPWRRKKMKVCETCLTDFKEFVQRKSEALK
jgi:hypothetical protein